ncbi:MAG: hypothetical protein MZV70_54115 [Desulfobacterales bacterium]|nr:hypothetical protein [Desulfobacterales bacterium]
MRTASPRAGGDRLRRLDAGAGPRRSAAARRRRGGGERHRRQGGRPRAAARRAAAVKRFVGTLAKALRG